MNVKKSELATMIREAVVRRIRELHEAEQGADPDAVEKGDPEKEVDMSPKKSPDAPPPEIPQEPVEEPPPAEDENDPGKEDALDVDGDAGQEGSGEINDAISGKSVQSVTMENDSKILPGAKEVILSFSDSTDALRILVTATGRVAFFFKNQMHDIP